jgi:DNA-binding HxlR family transcriptional regulator
MARQHAQLVETQQIALPAGTLRLIGDTLAVQLLNALAIQELRFGELQRIVPKKSTKTVAARLKSLERAGLLTRTLYAEVPPRAVYRITDKGRELTTIVAGIADWENSWRQ